MEEENKETRLTETLLDVVEDADDMGEPPPRFANVYAVTRNYGGPEEGGWWFNSGEPVGCLALREGEDKSKLRKELEERYRPMQHGNIYSANGGVEIHVYFETEPAKAWPERRPMYE